MKVRRTKPQKTSPTFEKINQDLRKQCAETVESARRIIEASKRLTDAAHQLLEEFHRKRRQAN